MYVVKPMYFQKDGITVTRTFLVFDVNNPKFKSTAPKGIAPNYALPSGGDVKNELRRHFDALGVHPSQWRITPPNFENYLASPRFLSGVEIRELEV